MNKKKGFTLIELLAVIVILAIIALIAVPTILGVVDKAKKGSLQDSAYGLIEAADLYYAEYLNGKTVRFDIEDNNMTTEEENKLIYKGNIKKGTVLINNKGEVTVCINDGKHAAYKNYNDTKVTVVDSKTCTVPESNYIVYLDGESTVTEMTNLELTEEIENLKAEIAVLKSEKSNQTNVTNSINNLTNTHNSDISLINSKLGNVDISTIGNGTITGAISNLNSYLFSPISKTYATLTTSNGGINSDVFSNESAIYLSKYLNNVYVTGTLITKVDLAVSQFVSAFDTRSFAYPLSHSFFMFGILDNKGKMVLLSPSANLDYELTNYSGDVIPAGTYIRVGGSFLAK